MEWLWHGDEYEYKEDYLVLVANLMSKKISFYIGNVITVCPGYGFEIYSNHQVIYDIVKDSWEANNPGKNVLLEKFSTRDTNFLFYDKRALDNYEPPENVKEQFETVKSLLYDTALINYFEIKRKEKEF